jgi:hypothetical protein
MKRSRFGPRKFDFERMQNRMQAQYRCYFLDRDGNGRALTSISAKDPASAVEIARKRYPALKNRTVEVFEGLDRVFSSGAVPTAMNDDGLRRTTHAV